MGICVTIFGAMSYSYFNLMLKDQENSTKEKEEQDIEAAKAPPPPNGERSLPPYPGVATSGANKAHQ